jgi:hypothetical protein
MNRAVVVCALAAGVALLAGNRTFTQSPSAPRVIQTAELADTPLGAFHNLLTRYSIDEITDDHGVRLGSFGSDIFNDPADSYNEFWAVSDRGPNGNPTKRTFVTPSFTPIIFYARVHDNRLTLLNARPIVDASGRPVTGLSNVADVDETPWNFDGSSLINYNPNGLDTEGIVRTRRGDFWLVDEYSPSLVHVDGTGRVLDRYVPDHSPLATTLANTPNYRVKKYLPRILNARRQNRGFEGVALAPDQQTLFLAMQSPLDYPTTAIGRASRSVRILRWDIASERVTGEFVYFFDDVCAFLRQPAGCTVVPGEMKISGLHAVSATSVLVLERTDTAAKVYRVTLNGATDILASSWDTVAPSPTASTASLEGLANPSTAGIAVLPKTLVVDISTLPDIPNKIEGISLVRPDVLAIANDNDFGMIDNATFNAAGRMTSDTGVKSKIIYVQLASPVD